MGINVGTGIVTVTGNVTVTNFPATWTVTQSGPWSVAVNNFPASFAVSNFPASFAISNFPATQPVSGSVAVSNFPATQPVSGPQTDTEYKSSWQAPWALSVALGRVPTKDIQRSFGINPNVGAVTELISTEGVAAPFMPSAAVTVEIVSTSANDTSAGTGARSVTVIGLDSAFNLLTQTVNTNGVTPVTLPSTMTRVFHSQVTTCGTYGGNNAGTITVRQSGGGTTFVTIQATSARSFIAHYCVPVGYKMSIMDVHFQIESSTAATLTMFSRTNANVVVAPFAPIIARRQYNSADSVIDWTYDTSPIIIGPCEDVWFAASANGAPSVSCEFIGTIEPL